VTHRHKTAGPGSAIAGPSGSQRKAQAPVSASKGKLKKLQPADDKKLRKCKTSCLNKLHLLDFKMFRKLVLPTMHIKQWYKIFRQLNASAVSANTRSKYSSAINKIKKYCAIFQIDLAITNHSTTGIYVMLSWN
jgi:hypothetical protein